LSTTAIVVVTIGGTLAAITWAICWAAVRVAQLPSKSKETP
jgi:hypothetical protein